MTDRLHWLTDRQLDWSMDLAWQLWNDHTIVQCMQVAICSGLPSEGVLLFSFLDMISDHKLKVVFYHPTILILSHEARFWQKYLSTIWGSLITILNTHSVYIYPVDVQTEIEASIHLVQVWNLFMLKQRSKESKYVYGVGGHTEIQKMTGHRHRPTDRQLAQHILT